MTAPKPRRKPPKTDTERGQAAKACLRHLKDLRRAHSRPPADVAIRPVAIPKWVNPVPSASWCTSPAQLCAELAE